MHFTKKRQLYVAECDNKSMIKKNPVYIIQLLTQSSINIAKWFLYEPKFSILLTGSIGFSLAKYFGKYTRTIYFLITLLKSLYLFMGYILKSIAGYVITFPSAVWYERYEWISSILR